MLLLPDITKPHIQDFINNISQFVTREITYYEQCAMTFAIVRLLNKNDWALEYGCSPTIEDMQERPSVSNCVFCVGGAAMLGGSQIQELLDMAEAICDFIQEEPKTEVEYYFGVKSCPIYFIFFELILMFEEVGKTYRKILIEEKNDEYDEYDDDDEVCD